MLCVPVQCKKSTIFVVDDDDAAPPALPRMPYPIADDELQMHGDLRFDIGKVQTICAKWLIKVPVNKWGKPTLK